MKKLFVIILTVFCFVLPFAMSTKEISSADETSMSVLATQCFLYSQPSFDEKVVDENGEQIILKHGDHVNVLSGGEDSEKFLYVSFEDVKGYVFKYYVTSSLSGQEVYPVFNANVVVDDAVVFDIEGQQTQMTLPKNTELYLYEGYKKAEEFTAVCFVLEDSSLFYGYLRTIDLQPYGINAGLITGLVAAASCVTIILLLLFMKKEKKEKKKSA